MPLIGDRIYHPTQKAVGRKGAQLPYGFKRQALHAATIGIIHPTSGKSLDFSPKFLAICSCLKSA